jgi:hypothetical protein
MAAEPEHAAHASSGLLRVEILVINRSPQGYHDLLGPLLPSAPLRELQQACKHAGVEAPNGPMGGMVPNCLPLQTLPDVLWQSSPGKASNWEHDIAFHMSSRLGT